MHAYVSCTCEAGEHELHFADGEGPTVGEELPCGRELTETDVEKVRESLADAWEPDD